MKEHRMEERSLVPGFVEIYPVYMWRKVCAYCKVLISEQEVPWEPTADSHGICEGCLESMPGVGGQ